MKAFILALLSFISLNTYAGNWKAASEVLNSREVEQFLSENDVFFLNFTFVTIKDAGIAESQPIIQKFQITLRGNTSKGPSECSFQAIKQGPKITATNLVCLDQTGTIQKMVDETKRGCNQ